MKALFITLALASSALTAYAGEYSVCQEKIEAANTEVKFAKDSYDVGETTGTVLDLTKLNLLRVRLACHDILFKEYCEQAPALATKVAAGIADEVTYQPQYTSFSKKDRFESKLLAAEIVDSCK